MDPMDRHQWPTAAAVNDVWDDINTLGIKENIADLDAFGFTVLPPEFSGEPDFIDELRDKVLEIAARRHGQSPEDGFKQTGWYLLVEDPIFEKVMMNQASLTVAKYMLGNSMVYSGQTYLLRREGDAGMDLHTDSIGIPAPLPAWASMANVTWALTDYTTEGGCLGLVPGSHRWNRQPLPHEMKWTEEGATVKPVPIEVPKGSIIAWHGNMWHGAFPKAEGDTRVTIVNYWVRSFMRVNNDWRGVVTDEMIARNPEEFRHLLGLTHGYPQDPRGLDAARVKGLGRFKASGMNQWA